MDPGLYTQHLEIHRSRLSSVTARASLDGLDSTHIRSLAADLRRVLDSAHISRFGRNSLLPSGTCLVTGRIGYHSRGAPEVKAIAPVAWLDSAHIAIPAAATAGLSWISRFRVGSGHDPPQQLDSTHRPLDSAHQRPVSVYQDHKEISVLRNQSTGFCTLN